MPHDTSVSHVDDERSWQCAATPIATDSEVASARPKPCLGAPSDRVHTKKPMMAPQVIPPNIVVNTSDNANETTMDAAHHFAYAFTLLFIFVSSVYCLAHQGFLRATSHVKELINDSTNLLFSQIRIKEAFVLNLLYFEPDSSTSFVVLKLCYNTLTRIELVGT